MEQFIKNLARGAGAILRDGFRKEFKFKQKSAAWDIVTEFDEAAERFVIDRIRKKYPRHGIMSEESGHIKKYRDFWVIDPLDGTHAFARGIPQFSVSIAFVSRGVLRYGAVYDPIADELFVGVRGSGSTMNGKKIAASAVHDPQVMIICIILGSKLTQPRERAVLYEKMIFRDRLWESHLESCALTEAYVAAGRYDVMMTKNLNPWDYSAGALIMAEAGAKVTDWEGRPYRWNSLNMLAANPVLYKKVMTALKSK